MSTSSLEILLLEKSILMSTKFIWWLLLFLDNYILVSLAIANPFYRLQTFVQATAGSGGWPMSVFLTVSIALSLNLWYDPTWV